VPALDRPGTVLLDADRPDRDSGASGALLFTHPREALAARTAEEVGPLLDALDRVRAEGRWAAGFLAYEAGYALEPALFTPPVPGLLGWFGVYDAPRRMDASEVDAALPDAPIHVENAALGMDEAGYTERIGRIRHHIREGDVYQINLTLPLRFRLRGEPAALYAALRRRQRVSYGAYLALDGARILSRSPELFVRLDGGRLTARPMKGTTPRGATGAEDDALAAALAADPKNRAENLMIVDLLRNDLARVAAPGSVAVPALFETERYATLTQMTSTVTARLRPGLGVADVLRALFPCGSVTGAPKLRAMQLIRELEETPRGVYCGAIGYVGPEGAAFSVPIRTAVLRRDGGAWAGTLGIGSGVVWDSEAAAEYAECRLKARFLLDLDRPGDG
jgi:para-aminobenzoate synthetase/4-amino-4-deoxychorismate lyase